MTNHVRPWFVATIRVGRRKFRLRLVRWRVALIVAVVLVAPVFYVLSAGPVVFLMTAAGIEDTPWVGVLVEGIYAPLILCMESSDFFGEWMGSYLELWEAD
jgi:hypothetical protein